jgi:hypothetical protein
VRLPVTMTRNETVARHGSTESSWSSRSGDTVRPYGRQGSLRGTPVTVRTTKDPNQYVCFRRIAGGAMRFDQVDARCSEVAEVEGRPAVEAQRCDGVSPCCLGVPVHDVQP